MERGESFNSSLIKCPTYKLLSLNSSCIKCKDIATLRKYVGFYKVLQDWLADLSKLASLEQLT